MNQDNQLLLLRGKIMKFLSLIIVGILMIVSCNHVDERDFFRFRISDAGGKCLVQELSLHGRMLPDIGAPDCVIKDSLVINSGNRSENLFHISDMEGGLIGSFCRRGRAWNEPLSGLPLSEVYVDDGDLYADVYSFMDAKLFVWNISRSMEEDRDVYEDIVQFKSEDDTRLKPWMSLYRLDESHIIVYNSMESGYSDTYVEIPSYQIYDLSEKQLSRQYDLFNVVDLKPEDPMLAANAFLSNVDCIKPDRSKIAFAMSLMPVYCILDLSTGKAAGYRIKGLPGMRTDEYRWHFADIQADDDYIYALYSGEIMFNEEGTDIPEVLYVMDWEGNLKAKYKMDKRFTSLSLDRDKLYFIHHDGAVAVIDTDTLKSGLL